MKTLLSLLATVLICGCTTLPNGNVAVAGYELQPAAVKRDLTVAAKYGTREGLRADPNSRAYFQAVVAVLNASLDAGVYDPTLLAQSLANISVKEIQEPHISDGIQAVMEIYAINFGQAIGAKLDATKYLRPILEGIRDGVLGGLQ